MDGEEMKNNWHWTVLLKEKGKDGKLTRATMTNSRVGCILDGAVVYFEDGHSTPCGPPWRPGGQGHSFGCHASQKIVIPENVDDVKVELTATMSSIDFDSICQMTLQVGASTIQSPPALLNQQQIKQSLASMDEAIGNEA
jgi:hypothetical protein